VSITRLQQARQMYAMGQRVGGIMGSNAGSMLVTPTRDGSRPGYYGPDAGHENDPGHGSNAPGGGEGGNRPNMADVAGPVSTTTNTTTNNNSEFDPFGHSRFNVGSGYYGETVTSPDPDGTTIDKFTPTFAPTVIKKTPLDYVKQLFSIASVLTPHTLVGKIGLGLGAYNKAKTGLQTVSSIANTFGINTDSITNSLSNNFSGTKSNTNTNTNTNDTNNNGGEEGLASLENQAGNYDEYVLLLQKLQSGNISDAERTRYTMLKNRLGI